MIYEAQGHTIDLTQITRLYPAVTINAGGERAQVSLEWAELKKDSIEIEAYVLVFDCDPLDEVPHHRVTLQFTCKEDLIEAMQRVSQMMA